VQLFKFRLNGQPANTITNGEPVVYVIQVQNDTLFGQIPVCDVTCASVLFQCPDSSGNLGPQIVVATNVNLPFGTVPFVAGSVTCVVSVASSVTSAKAHVDIIGVVHDVTVAGCSPDATCAVNPCDPDVGGGQQEVSVTVRTPCIDVTKQCVSAVNVGGNAVVVSFTGSVSNCGNETLVNVGITNNQPVAGTLVTNISSLAAGQVINFSGTYTNTSNICGPFPDTVTATGTGVGSLGIVTDSASAQCTITYTPSISVTKVCPVVAPLPGTTLTFTGMVCNTGNIALTNVTVVDDKTLTTGGNVVASFPLLTNGECRAFSGSISVPANVCSITDTLTARGTNICNGVGVVNTATATCPIACAPAIKVYKQVVCYSNACEPFSSDLNSQKSATGVVAGANCPAFCYQITVTNSGNVTLSNLVVFDSNSSDGKVLNLTGCGFPATLAVGATANCIVTTNHCVNSTNIITATAVGQVPTGTQTVSATDTNRVTVIPISVNCSLLISTNGGSSFFAPSVCATQSLGNSYIVRIVVTNSGQYALQNVTISSTAGLGACLPSARNLGTLAVGASTTVDCTNVCNAVGRNDYAVSVTAVVSQAAGHICDFNAQGVEITASSQCSACVVCVGAPAIKVYKQVVCYTPTGCETFDNNLNNQKSAFGVRVDPNNCPAFCYRIVVTNTGNIVLTNVIVVDDSNPNPDLNLVPCAFPTTLAVGASASCIVTNITHCSNTVNIVTATGVGFTGTQSVPVSAQDTNNVVVAPIAVNCAITVSTNGGSSFFAPSVCATQSLGNSYIVRIVVTNSGQYALQNVIISNTAGLGGCLPSPRNLGTLAIGASATIDCTNVCNEVGRTDYAVSVTAVASQAAGHVCDFNAQGVEITASSQCSACVVCKGQPLIKVYKQVVCYTPTGCEAFDNNLNNQKSAFGVRVDPNNCPAFCYRIVVTNTGNIALTNVAVVDDSNPNPDLNLVPCAFPTTLAVGASASCIVTNITHCSNTVNVVTATGTGFTGTESVPVSSQDTNNVVVNPIAIKCELTVSTNGGVSFFAPSVCATQLIGNSYIVRIAVTNNGQYALQNVTVSNIAGLTGCLPSARNIGSLAIGAGITIDCTNSCATTGRTDFTVAVSGEASQAAGHVCDHNSQGIQIIASSTCTTCVVCFGVPCIGVTKGIACVICTTNERGVVLACASATGGFEKEAYGVRSDTQDPAFCYQIVVTNCGDLALNVTITDAKLGLNDIAVGILAPHTIFTTNLVQDWHVTTTNVVIANGVAAGTGATVSATNFAIAHVRPASIACVKTVSVNGGPFQHTITLTNEVVTNISWAVTLTNTGQADLENVRITDLSQNDDLPCTVNLVVTNIFPVGGSIGPIIVCSNNTGFTSCTNLSLDNDIRIVASAAAEGTNCVWDIEGTNIIVQTSCDAHLNLFCVVPNACRVTGGGRQDDPTVCPSNVRYVTHGGQVGAPVGNKVCSIDTNLPNYFLGNPCIHGRWTHVRHAKGSGEGNFHARFFDTLDCACLDTNLNPDTCQYGQGTVLHGICGDRSTGPLPRPANANKIAFTGVGDWTCSPGGREPRSCLFRVDIEDRGEPGNAHALASNGKANRIPDRYRIRIWVLTESELAQLNGAGPDPYLIHFRDCISACNGIDFQDGGICSPNACSGDPCTGLGATGTITFPGGCPVRMPNIDDGGELLHGNHQIHPAIKNCDPFNPTGPGLAKP